MAITLRDMIRGSLSSVTSTLRLWNGLFVIDENIGKKNEGALLKLYDLEGCPFCRLVREKLTELDLDVEIVPCPKGDNPMRNELRERGGKVQLPYLVDPNTGVEIYESFDIINYLSEQYGDGKKRNKLQHTLSEISSALASASRPMKGIKGVSNVKVPEKLLELYSFEASPFVRPVKERLCELGIPYIVRNVGKQQMSDMGAPGMRMTTKPYHPLPGSKREALLERGGEVQVPYLIDPNTGTELYESWDIIEYLDKTYMAEGLIL